MKEIRELEHSYRHLNYANAAYQGRFAQLNILKQAAHPLYNDNIFEQTRNALKICKGIQTDFEAGQQLFLGMQGAPTAHGSKVLQLLTELKPELLSLANHTKRILATHDYYANLDDVALLIAAYGRNAYNRDNYILGLQRFAKFVNNGSALADLQQQHEANQQLIKDVNVFLMHYKNPMPEFPAFYEHLRFVSRILPGRFRSIMHDIAQLECGMAQIFNWDRAGFMKIEAQVWHQAGFQPLEAGYWRAYDVSVEDALRWKANQIENPEVAAEWLTAGFPIEVAVEWISVLLPPLVALQWVNQSFSPREASIFVSRGFSTPDQVPDGKHEEVLIAGLESWQKEYEQSQKNQK